MRGRVMSLYSLTFFGFAPFGNLAVGALAEVDWPERGPHRLCRHFAGQRLCHLPLDARSEAACHDMTMQITSFVRQTYWGRRCDIGAARVRALRAIAVVPDRYADAATIYARRASNGRLRAGVAALEAHGISWSAFSSAWPCHPSAANAPLRARMGQRRRTDHARDHQPGECTPPSPSLARQSVIPACHDRPGQRPSGLGRPPRSGISACLSSMPCAILIVP